MRQRQSAGSGGGGSGVSDYADLTGLPAIPFRPTGKYAPIKLTKESGWANGANDSVCTAVHDASAGAVPSYTTAKRGSFCIVTVAGTLGGVAAAKGDILVALQDNPTTAAHWAIVGDSTAEFEAAVEAAQGAPLDCDGITFMTVNADPDAPLNIEGGTCLNRCGYAAIYQASNQTHQSSNTFQATATAVSLTVPVDPYSGETIQPYTRFTLGTVGHAANFPVGTMFTVSCGSSHPDSAASSSKNYISETTRVAFVDTTNGYVFADRKLEYHNELVSRTYTAATLSFSNNGASPDTILDSANGLLSAGFYVGAMITVSGSASNNVTARITAITAGVITLESSATLANEAAGASVTITQSPTIYLNTVTEKRAAKIKDVFFMAAPTIIGESVGWWRTLEGSEVSGTITASSGQDRTISRTAHGLIVGQEVRVGTVAGTRTTSCNVKTVTNANEFVITVPSNQDYVSSSPSIPTSGTLYYAPKFAPSDFDTTTHGACVVLVHSNGFHVRSEAAKLWAGRLKARFSSYGLDESIRHYGKNAWTESNNGSGSLDYDHDDYVSWRNHSTLTGSFGRHAYTDNAGDTSGAFSTSTWLTKGTPGANFVQIIEMSSDGGGADDHIGRGTRIDSKAFWPAAQPYSSSYKGYGGNIRGSNTKRTHRQHGGNEGVILRAVEAPFGNVCELDLEVSDIPYSSTSNMGFRSESFAAKSSKPLLTGRMRFKNAGVGGKFAGGIKTNLDLFSHSDVGKYGLWLIDDTKFYATDLSLDFTANTEKQTSRRAVNMEDTASVSFGTMVVTLGAANNPSEIFSDSDATSGKTITGGRLIINDPDGIGMPNLVTSGSEANFTINLGDIYYNGYKVSSSVARRVPSGRIIVPPVSMNALTSFTHNTGTAYACIVDVPLDIYTGIAFGVHAAATALNVKLGLYRLNADGTLTLIESVTGGPYTDGADTSHTVAFAANRLVFGPCVLVVTTDANQALKAFGGSAVVPIVGMGNMVQGAGRMSFAHTYASALPSAPTLTYTEGSGMAYLGLVKA